MSEEVTKLIEKMGKDFEEFKTTNNARLEAVAKGQANSELDAKVEKIGKSLLDMEALKTKIETLEKAAHRSNVRVLDKKGNPLPEDHATVTKAYGDFLRKGNKDGSREFGWAEKSMSVQSDPDGGYTVTADMSGRMVGFIYESSPVRQLASIQVIGTDAYEGTYDQDEVDSGWVGETGSRPTTDTAQIGKWSIPVHEQYANPKATQKLLDDSNVNIEDWLARKLSDKFARVENTSFVVGNGSSKPRGFMTYAQDTTEKVGIEQINSGHATLFTAEGLKDLTYALKEPYRSNAVFALNRASVLAISKIKGVQNDHFMWQPSLAAGLPATLLGYRYVEMADIVAPTAGSLSAMFADFKEMYQIVDRTGLRVLRDPYTAKPFVQFYTTKRVGGGVLNFQAGKIQKISA